MRDQRGKEGDKKTFIPDKSENEGIQESCFALAEQAGLILLLTEKLAPFGSHDEHNQTDILTSDVTSLPPSRHRSFEQDSGQWEFVVRYSGATVPDSHGVP